MRKSLTENLHDLTLDEQSAIENHDAIMAMMRVDPPSLTMMAERSDDPIAVVGQNGDNNGLPFTDDQIDGLADMMVQMRTEIDDAIESAMISMRDRVLILVQDSIASAVDPLRERIATIEGRLQAMTDLKGIPGKPGEKGARGEVGRPGARGAKGEDGQAFAAPHWIGVKIEGFDLITVMSNGTMGPRVSLEKMFAEFAKHMVIRGAS
jgi:hypothetical protein